jgi:hypothetical protein
LTAFAAPGILEGVMLSQTRMLSLGLIVLVLPGLPGASAD